MAFRAFEASDFAGARDAYRDIVKCVPENEDAWINLGTIEVRRAHAPGTGRPRFDTCSCLILYFMPIEGGHLTAQERIQSFRDARQTYLRAIALHPDSVKPYNAICRLLLTEVWCGP